MDDENQKTLSDHRAAAKANGNGMLVGTLSYLSKEWAARVHHTDMWQLAIVLGTVLAYLYTRDVVTVILLFIAAYFLGYLVFWLVSYAMRETSAPLSRSHTVDESTIADPVIAGLTLLLVYFSIEASAVGSGVGSDIVLARELQSFWRTALVLLAVFFTGFVRLYWISLTMLLGVIWLAYAFDAGRDESERAYALWLALRASGFTIGIGAVFIRPIVHTFFINSLIAVVLIGWFSGLVHLVYLQQ